MYSAVTAAPVYTVLSFPFEKKKLTFIHTFLTKFSVFVDTWWHIWWLKMIRNHMKLIVTVFSCLLSVCWTRVSSMYPLINPRTHTAPGRLLWDHIPTAKVCILGNASLHPDQQWLNPIHCLNNTPLLYGAMIDGNICCWVNTTLLKWSGSQSQVAKHVGPRTAGMHCVGTCALTKGLSSFPGLFSFASQWEKHYVITL